MKSVLSVLVALAAMVDVTSAHYRCTSLVVDGKSTGEYVNVRQNTNHNSPVTDVMSKDMVCNVGGLVSGNSTKVATVAAGSKVGFALDQAVYHAGPATVWLSPSPTNVTTYDGSGEWAKIWEIGANITAGSIKFPASGQAQFNFQIPACAPAGQYLLRFEQIGLHTAGAKGGAQFYIACAQIEVTGSGSGKFSPTVKFPGAYSADDPGIKINIYNPIPTSYTIPGGPVAKC